jgi:hypothetical protein
VNGGADHEVSKRRHAAVIAACDLMTNVLRGVGEVELS